ncbi:hypothetical protein [uncultured Ruegeria sp.]|uniref:hypothetical protein n=1 Tax=uncultured Ruegeria sp. TaxID=259304 RepID=UPI00260DA916|nr:hypothetical protein [uncultured Ruegeria sp.]
MIKAIFSLILSVLPRTAMAFIGPVSGLEKYDCVIVERCDAQKLCKMTREKSELIVTTTVFMAPINEQNGNNPYDLIERVDEIAWVDFARYSRVPVPLPIWFKFDFVSGEAMEFRLNDWLYGKQISPYDEQSYAFVFEADASNDDEVVDLWENQNFWFRLYIKRNSAEARFETIKMICPEYGK